jgi:hypothetical protein
MRDVTLILPHYMNLGMLAEQQRVWRDYPADLRAHLHVVVVDDCSPTGSRPVQTSFSTEGLASVRYFRLLEKKRWNWLACRNLGARMAFTDWILLTDIDHVVPPETLRRIVDGPVDPSDVYRFKRVTALRRWPYDVRDASACEPSHKAHNDTWLLTRALFYYDDGVKFVDGYDERLSGCYGTSGEFRDRLVAVAARHHILSEAIVRYPRELIADASTSPDVYTRKGDPENDADLQQRKQVRAQLKDWRPLHELVRWIEVPIEHEVPA